MHDEAHHYVVGGKLNNECSTLLFSPFSSFVSQNREYAHISQWTFKSWEYIHFALFCGNFVQKLNHRKKGEIFHLFERVRDLDYVLNKLAARWVKLSAEARTLVADCNVLLLHSKDVSSYIDPQKQVNQNGG